MKQKLLLALLLTSTALEAQTLTTTVIQRYFNAIRRNIEATADVVPAEKYNFKLTEGQNTFAWWMLHAAGRNYQDCAVLKGETPPTNEEKLQASLKDKADITKAVKDSFAYCATIFTSLDDSKVLASPQTTYSFLHTVVHNNEVYGNVVGYMRSMGIVPPSTASAAGRGR